MHFYIWHAVWTYVIKGKSTCSSCMHFVFVCLHSKQHLTFKTERRGNIGKQMVQMEPIVPQGLCSLANQYNDFIWITRSLSSSNGYVSKNKYYFNNNTLHCDFWLIPSLLLALWTWQLFYPPCSTSNSKQIELEQAAKQTGWFSEIANFWETLATSMLNTELIGRTCLQMYG